MNNSQGQSLVQVLVAVGILGIVLGTFTTMMANQQRGATQAGQKMASLDLQRVVTTALSDPSGVCNYMVTNASTMTFNPMTVGSASPPSFSFPNIPTKGVAGAPPLVAVSTTSPASLLSTSLFVNAITIKDLQCVPSPCTPATNQFSANLTLGYDQTKLVQPMIEPKFPVTLSTISAGPLQQLKGCTSGNLTSGNCVTRYPATVTKGPCGIGATAMCLPGETAVSGGGAYGSNTALQNSMPVVDASGRPVGWSVTWFDPAYDGSTGSICNINVVADGTTAPGSGGPPPGGPCFVNKCGTAMVVCCR